MQKAVRIAIGLGIGVVAAGISSRGGAQELLMRTVAGGGPHNVPALAANLDRPADVVVAVDGSLFVSSSVQSRAFKIDPTQILNVYAGVGSFGRFGDDGPAIAAHLASPAGLALDAAGNLFIADWSNHTVRRVNAATGVITTVAGSGYRGFGGDGDAAVYANIDSPRSVALDDQGNLFIADWGNRRVRRVNAATGIIDTVAGNGDVGFSGDGELATNASLSNPYGLALDAQGNLYFADLDNARIRFVDASTGIITTVVGNGDVGFGGDGGAAIEASLAEPRGIALDGEGNLYIADSGNHRIRRVDGASGVITTVAGDGAAGFGGDGGSATSARLNDPSGISMDAVGNFWIADSLNDRIRRVDAATGIIRSVAGNGTRGFSGDGGSALLASMASPRDVASDEGGALLIADQFNYRVRRVDSFSGVITTLVGNGASVYGGDGGPATSASLVTADWVTLDSSGNLYVTDTHGHRIRRVDAVTGIITTFAGNGIGAHSGDGGLATNASLHWPADVAIDAAGSVFIADSSNHRIRRVDAITGKIFLYAGNGGIGFGGDGNLAIATPLNYPKGLAFDADGNLLFADSGNGRIRRISVATGIINTIAGGGSISLPLDGDGGPALGAYLNRPGGLALDAAGNLFISESSSHRVRRVDAASGIITTLAGWGAGFSGDGGARYSSLSFPGGLAVDAAGNLMIADSGTDRIRRVGETFIPIELDILPDSGPNFIDPTSEGLIDVAILGSLRFGVHRVDGTTLRLGIDEASPVDDLGDPEVFADHLEDVNGDGVADLVPRFRIGETGIAARDSELCLTGATIYGAPFEGCDAIRTFRPRSRRR